MQVCWRVVQGIHLNFGHVYGFNFINAKTDVLFVLETSEYCTWGLKLLCEQFAVMNKDVIFEVLWRVLLYVGLLWYPVSCFKGSKSTWSMSVSVLGVFWISWGPCSAVLSSIINVFSSHSSYACILLRWQSSPRKLGFVNKTVLSVCIYMYIPRETDHDIFNIKVIIAVIESQELTEKSQSLSSLM